MPPTERQILTAFLLSPAPLPTIISLQQFTAYFPHTAKNASRQQIRTLYRSLQHRRALVVDAVAQEIEAEVKRGKAQRRVVVRTRRADELGVLEGLEEGDVEGDLERAVSVPFRRCAPVQTDSLRDHSPESRP